MSAERVAEFLKLTCARDDMIDMELTDGELALRLKEWKPRDPVKNWVPAYDFDVMLADKRIGSVNLRVGYVESLFFGGNVGYNIEAEYRGRGYAARACRLLAPLLRAHGMKAVYITNNIENIASRRVCEKLGLTLICVADVPEWSDLYKDGYRKVNVFRWEL